LAGVQQMQESLYQKIRQGGLSIDQQKKLIGSLIHLDIQGDPAWESVQTRCHAIFELEYVAHTYYTHMHTLCCENTNAHCRFTISTVRLASIHCCELMLSSVKY
jgi:hypothetical protein